MEKRTEAKRVFLFKKNNFSMFFRTRFRIMFPELKPFTIALLGLGF